MTAAEADAEGSNNGADNADDMAGRWWR